MQTANRNILESILETKRGEVAAAKERTPLDAVQKKASEVPHPLPFVTRLRDASFPPIIAEIKRASPSKGIIRADLDPLQVAKSYAATGAACLSVLTDELYFQGKLEYLAAIKAELLDIPLLRKDFTCDRYQVWETRAARADALLLIVAALSQAELGELIEESARAELGVLIEVHTPEELTAALEAINDAIPPHSNAPLPLLGINNRDLKTFVTDLAVTERILQTGREISPRFRIGLNELNVVAESGVKTGADIKQLTSYGAEAFLIGESLLVSGDPGENLARLIAQSRDI